MTLTRMPKTVDELSLPCVRSKIAFLCLHATWDGCALMFLILLDYARVEQTLPRLRSSSKTTTANSIATPNPDSDRFHSSSLRRSERVKVEWYPMLGVIKSRSDRLPNKTTTRANAVFRICAFARETRSNQTGSQKTSFHTWALAGKLRHRQRHALTVPCASGCDGLQHGQVE